MSFEKSKNKFPLNFSLFPVGAASSSDDNHSVFSSSVNYSSGGVVNGNSSKKSGHYQIAPNKPSVENGLSLLRRIKIEDDLNISSSTAVAENNFRYFGDHVDSFDLPSPIENLPSNPLDIQLSSLSTSTAAGSSSSGYTSGLYNSNEYFEPSLKYVSDPSILLHNDKYKTVKFESDTDSLTTATRNVLRNHPNIVHESIAGSSRSCENWVPSEMKVNFSNENSSFLEKDSLWSSEITDIFSTASDSAYLVPDDIKHSRASISEESYRGSGLMDPEENGEQSMLNLIPRFQRSLNISNVRKSIQGRVEAICKFCVTNKEPHEECKHQLKDEFGLITCPVLYTYICDICGSTGSYAHTRKHCPMKEEYLAPTNNNAKAPFKKWRNGIVTLK